jgi:hypothetical protein
MNQSGLTLLNSPSLLKSRGYIIKGETTMKKFEKTIFAIAVIGILSSVTTGIAIAVTRGEPPKVAANPIYCGTSECGAPGYCFYCEAANAGVIVLPPAARADMYFRLGQLERQRAESSRTQNTDAVYIRGADFVIRKSEIDISEERFIAMGTQNPREHAVQEHLRHEALYAQARSHGFYATEKEVREFIDNGIEWMGNSANFEDDMVPFLRGAEMTLEEYWESRHDIIRKEIAVSKYYDWLRMTFYVENGYADNSGIIRDFLEKNSFDVEISDEINEIFSKAEMFENEWMEHFDKTLAALIDAAELVEVR